MTINDVNRLNDQIAELFYEMNSIERQLQRQKTPNAELTKRYAELRLQKRSMQAERDRIKNEIQKRNTDATNPAPGVYHVRIP
jgi:regulator of replication initiation timing